MVEVVALVVTETASLRKMSRQRDFNEIKQRVCAGAVKSFGLVCLVEVCAKTKGALALFFLCLRSQHLKSSQRFLI